MSAPALTITRPSLTLRAGAALALALLIHLSAWQTLSGIRFFLPRHQPPPAATIDATLLPAQAPTRLPARRAEVRGAVAPAQRGQAAPLTAVRTDRRARPAASPPSPKPKHEPQRAASEKAGAPAPGGAESAAASAQPTASPEPPAPAPPAPAPQAPAAAASPTPEAPTPAAAAAGQPAPAAPPAPALPPHRPMQVVLPNSARLVYASYASVRAGGFVLPVRGRTTMRWQFQDGHYQSDLSIDVVNFAQSSQGRFDPDVGLQPERFSETRPRRPVATTQFDWASRRVSFTEEGKPAEAEPGMQDRLSIQFQLSVLRQVYPDLFVRGTVVPFALAGTRDVTHWTFTVTGDDTVDSALGHLPAVRVVSNRSTSSGDESLEVWICEKLHWFPVRIRMVDRNRNVLDFVLDEVTMN